MKALDFHCPRIMILLVEWSIKKRAMAALDQMDCVPSLCSSMPYPLVFPNVVHVRRSSRTTRSLVTLVSFPFPSPTLQTLVRAVTFFPEVVTLQHTRAQDLTPQSFWPDRPWVRLSLFSLFFCNSKRIVT